MRCNSLLERFLFLVILLWGLLTLDEEEPPPEDSCLLCGSKQHLRDRCPEWTELT